MARKTGPPPPLHHLESADFPAVDVWATAMPEKADEAKKRAKEAARQKAAKEKQAASLAKLQTDAEAGQKALDAKRAKEAARRQAAREKAATPEPHCSPGKEAEESAGGARRPQDSWKDELQGIRSDLGALRACLEGRPALEQELQSIRSDLGALRDGLQGRAALKQELQMQFESLEASSRTRSKGLSRRQTLESLGVFHASGAPPGGADGPSREASMASSPSKLSSHMQNRRAVRLQRTSPPRMSESIWLQAKAVPIIGPCLEVFGKLGTSEAPQRSDPLSKFVDGRLFHTLVYLAILLNCVFMVVVADEEMHVAIHDPDRGPSDSIAYGETFFLCVYLLEFILKWWRFRWHFFYDASWKFNWIDLALVLAGIYSTFFEGLLPNCSWMRMLRMLRLAKALRVLRLISIVKPLQAILQSITNTVDTLAWSIVMLLVILFLFALMIVIRAASFLQEDPGQGAAVIGENGETVKDTLEANYGSVGLAILHLFMCCTGGDWSVYYASLVPTGATNCILFLLFVAFTQVALLNIILGIFVDDAMKSMLADRDERVEENAEEQLHIEFHLRKRLHELDKDSDGMLSAPEMLSAMETPKIQNLLEMVGFRASEMTEFVEYMYAEGDDLQIDIETFVGMIMRFRGTASCFDMQMVLNEVEELKALVALVQGAKNVHVEIKA